MDLHFFETDNSGAKDDLNFKENKCLTEEAKNPCERKKEKHQTYLLFSLSTSGFTLMTFIAPPILCIITH
jgi:hypothetical protein